MKVFFLEVVVTFLEAQMGKNVRGGERKSFKGGCILHPEKSAAAS